MLIYLNEKLIKINSGTRLYELRKKYKADADLLIVNGYPASSDQELNDSDHIVMIQRGEQPSAEELEILMMARHTPGVHEKIKQGCVGIAGAGGLGSHVAVALARVGVGQLNIADFDVVEPSNLNRQQYFIDQIGSPKVLALRDNLLRINPGTKVNIHQKRVTPENITELFSEVDILVEAFDAADQKAMLTNYFLSHFPDKFLVAASGVAGYKAANTIQTTKITDHFYLCGDGVTAAEPGCGLMAPRVGIAAHHQANAVLRLLLNQSPE
ncbi:MAG: sulfur carrier protein ThiS adenylyltransferase ThiF [Thermodesulfobacteriota bacterium]|nr:sulfur carrier protein ThiS adenylyltransferase ThiF [Thermodesulfobacteriota bacterium]